MSEPKPIESETRGGSCAPAPCYAAFMSIGISVAIFNAWTPTPNVLARIGITCFLVILLGQWLPRIWRHNDKLTHGGPTQ